MTTTAAPRDTAFFGHPKGLAYLAFTEAWERFSYYGMTPLLALYILQQLLTPGHASHVLGPLLCGGLAEAYGWHVGLACAGALMIVALLTYLAGQRHLPGGRAPAEKIVYPPLTPAERRRTWLLIAVILLTVLPNIAYPM